MSYKKFTPKVVAPTAKQATTQPARKVTPSTGTSRQELDVYLKQLTQLVEKDPKKAAEVFKSWLDRPSKIVKPKRAA